MPSKFEILDAAGNSIIDVTGTGFIASNDMTATIALGSVTVPQYTTISASSNAAAGTVSTNLNLNTGALDVFQFGGPRWGQYQFTKSGTNYAVRVRGGTSQPEVPDSAKYGTGGGRDYYLLNNSGGSTGYNSSLVIASRGV